MDDQVIVEFLASLPCSAQFKFVNIRDALGFDNKTLLQKILCRYLNCVVSKTELCFLESTIISDPVETDI